MKILGIYREPKFSPDKVREDAAILDAVLQVLSGRGREILAIPAESLNGTLQDFDLILSMSQSERSLKILEKAGRRGTPVVNAVSAVRNCHRMALMKIFSRRSIPMPAGRIESVRRMEASGALRRRHGYWLKRGDHYTLGPGDVVRIGSCGELSRTLSHFRAQGVKQVIVQDHVEGPCVKFYAVGTATGSYFKAFFSPSGQEVTEEAGPLCRTAKTAAACVGLEIYGGDAVLSPDGTWKLIDLNDWPTFSLCRESAAWAIAEHLERSGAIKGALYEIT